MTIAIVKNSTFTHLNGDRSLRLKENSASRERHAIVDITYGAGDTYASNGNILDFSKLGFKQVYYCEILQKSYVNEMSFVAGAANAANLGKLKVWDSSGVELTNTNAATESMTLTCEIRGI